MMIGENRHLADNVKLNKHHKETSEASTGSLQQELVQAMISSAKLDSRKRCLLAITNQWGETALHFAAQHHSDPAVVEFLISEHPLAQSATKSRSRTPLQLAAFVHRRNPNSIISLLTDATNALAASDYAALATRVHGSAFALSYLASPSYAACIAVRTSLLLCLKNVHPDVPVAPTEPLDLLLPHARL